MDFFIFVLNTHCYFHWWCLPKFQIFRLITVTEGSKRKQCQKMYTTSPHSS